MTFSATKDVVESLHDSLQTGERWCESVEQGSHQNPEFAKVASVVLDEIRTRRLSVEDQLQSIPERVGATRLQYARPEVMQSAADQLIQTHPQSPSDLRKSVAEYYGLIRDELDTCIQSAASTSASDVVQQLHEEIETGISNVMWKTRPDQEQSEIESGNGPDITSENQVRRVPASSAGRKTWPKQLFRPDYPQLDSEHRWLPFGLVVMGYFVILGIVLLAIVMFVF